MKPAYAELQVTSNFSFLRGGASPAEYVVAADAIGLHGLAITDRNTVAGIVRGWDAARELNLKYLSACRVDLVDAPSVLLYPTDRAAYGRMTSLLTRGKRRAPKAQCHLTRDDLLAYAEGLIAIALPGDGFEAHLRALREAFDDRLYVGASHLFRGDDARRIALLQTQADAIGAPLVALGDTLYHVPARRPLQDVLTCIREKCTIQEAGSRLEANAERCLKSPREMARLFANHPGALEHTIEITQRCTFDLGELKYEYPAEPVPEGLTPQLHLEERVWTHAAEKYHGDVPIKVRDRLNTELKLIAELDYAPYFLTVYDIVNFARSQKILCQGRGSAANSIVCYILGITAVSPDMVDTLFERFVSPERKEPPDIDVDFEHERREEVIQYIYKKYTRDRAALTATLITYRPRSAIRDVGKAMGLSQDVVDRLAQTLWGWGRDGVQDDYVREAGLDPEEPTIRATLALTRALLGFPRHLSQHVGGFVISAGPLHETVPIENAAMDDRTVIEWDKDDLDSVGLLKIDVLALGMLTCLRKGLDLLARHKNLPLQLGDIEDGDRETYEMLQRADSVGVFQVESRAQMSMLPRLKPETFYDLVVEVAIVRPGPIQGDMVHPYLRRRSGLEPVTYPKEELREVLHKTCGVPLFQEQAMKIAMVAAKFTGSEANQLRRAMATFRHTGTIHTLKKRFITGMVDNGYELDFAQNCFAQIEGFGDYGFPESHAASFALLVYVSAWMKCHHPDVFGAALLNSLPMGFYAPAQLVRDAREHGVEIRPVDVNHSDWDCTLEPSSGKYLALRLGMRQAKGVSKQEAETIMAVRARMGPFERVEQLRRIPTVTTRTINALAKADAFGSMQRSRRDALWRAQGFDRGAQTALEAERVEPTARLRDETIGEAVLQDYAHLRLSLKAHPVGLFRRSLTGDGYVQNKKLADWIDGESIHVAGLVLIRQQPGTASGVIFVTLEDETGIANLVVWPSVFEQYRRVLLGSEVLGVRGKVQREGIVVHVVAEELFDLSDRLHGLAPANDSLMPRSRDFK
ncbi:error-prone DNA polymerase [Roseiterribacter gracilis]|uniref:Error-prone DNA polymerase n=1 Tax=Roseiterribacter gracilis TaxID=2812848 RepID=A0A8S8XLJ0_9PROT|nr:error-prone DNA polymerase 2 [Rhodospirillales bacterium TMPK1]